MSYYGMISTTLVAETEEKLMEEVQQYSHYPMFRQGPIWDTASSPKFRQQGKLATVITYFQT